MDELTSWQVDANRVECKPGKTPWRVWRRSLVVMLPPRSYKSELLTPKPKAYHHLLSEGCHPLQGHKQDINLCLRCTRNECLFFVYRLVVDAKTREGDGAAGWKYLSLLKEFQAAVASMAHKRHLHQAQGVYVGFCFSCWHRIAPMNHNSRETVFTTAIDLSDFKYIH